MTAHESFGAGSYRARCERVVDGDTIRVVADLGLYIHITLTVRLLGVNSPEMHARETPIRAAAAAAKAFTEAWVAAAAVDGREWPLRIQTVKGEDSFGRWLARVFRPGPADAELCLNDDLLAAGQAVAFRPA